MRFSQITLALLGFAAVASPADAGVVLAFDGSRCQLSGYQYWLTGNSMAGPLAQLQSRGYTVQTTNLITAAGLSGVDVFVSGLMNAGTMLSPSEFADLQAWVAAGGAVLYIGDYGFWTNSSNQFGSLVNGPTFGGQYASTNATLDIVAPGHPTISGPFGTVHTLTGFISLGSWTNLTPTCTTVCTNPDHAAAMVAVDYGAGRALLLNDTQYFCDPPTFATDKSILWDNAIEWLDHGGSSAGAFCFGDGTQSAPCPCGNSGTTARGCENSAATGGARLFRTGLTSPDTIVLHSTGETPTAPSIFLQGDVAISPLPFGDGLRCVHGVLKRLYVKPASGGIVAAPGPGDPSISARSAALGDPLAPGMTRNYQTYYRDPDPAFCAGPAGSTFNVSNGLQILW